MDYTFDMDEIIAKRLTGEISEAENAWLEQWLAQSAVNRRYFEQMQGLWQRSGSGQYTLSRPIDVEAALAKTKANIRAQKTAKSTPMRAWWLAAAAAVVLLLSAVWFLNQPAQTIIMAAAEQPLRDTLSDGSMIALNEHASVSATFDRKTRRVKMQGEVYFDVAPNAEKPFVIDVRQVEVTVIGTRFNVDNYSDSNKIIVSVESGKVKVKSGNETVFLTMGEQASIDCQSGIITRSVLPSGGNVKGWLDRRFVFDDVPLAEVLPIISNAYGVSIELQNPKLGACRLHTRFNDEPIERVLELIAETFSLQIENRNGRFYLNGAGCGNE